MVRVSLAALFALAALVISACKKAPAPEVASTCPACVRATDHGFVPARVVVPKGAPGSKTTITFTRETDDTCALDVVFPELGVKKPLPLNEAVVVEVPTDEARTLTFQCGMAMYKSAVVVE
jgi:plastocyanin domain-containing protein